MTVKVNVETRPGVTVDTLDLADKLARLATACREPARLCGGTIGQHMMAAAGALDDAARHLRAAGGKEPNAVHTQHEARDREA